MEEYAIGLDLGGTNLKGGIVSRNGKITAFMCTTSCIEEGPKKILNNLIKMAASLLKKAVSRHMKVIGIGVATPGIIDPVFGGLTGGAVNLPGWSNTPFMKILYDTLNVPLYAHNDVTATVLGEYWHGAGRGSKNIVMASFGTGIGGGIIIEGKLYGGATGYAGELGHIVVNAGGYSCACGTKGCWEEYASIRGILRTAEKYLNKDSLKQSRIFTIMKEQNKDLSPQIIFDAAKENDAAAMQIVDEIGRNTAVGIGSLINIFNPELFIVGGGIASAGDIYLHTIKVHLPHWTLKDSLEGAQVVLAQLGYEAGLIGASTLVFKNINRYQAF